MWLILFYYLEIREGNAGDFALFVFKVFAVDGYFFVFVGAFEVV